MSVDRHQAEPTRAGDTPLFSIITPTHDRAHLLPRAIQSVLNQTFADWELIIVDDGSADNTHQVVESFGDPRVRYFYQDHAGAAEARNLGTAYSQGQILIFLDSDDEVLPGSLELFARAFEQPQVGIVCGAAIRIVEQAGSRNETRLVPKDYGALYDHQAFLFLSGAFALSRDLFEGLGGYKNKSSRQQKDLAMRIIPYCLQQGLTIESLEIPVVRWFCHEGSRISTDVLAQYQGAKATLEDYGDLFLTKDPRRYATLCGVAGVNAFKLGRDSEARRFFWKALRQYPWYWKYHAAFLLSLFPPLGRLVWKEECGS